MRKLYFLSIFFFSYLSTRAQLIEGSDAAKLYTNADQVLMDEQGKKAKYIHFNIYSSLNIENFSSWAANELVSGGENSLVQIGLETDELGMIHYRYRQFFNGKPVQYSMIIAHTLHGKVISVNGDYYPQLSDNFQANFKEDEALKMALKSVNASVYAWQSLLQESIIKYIDNNADASYYPKAEMVYVSKNNSQSVADFRLAYKFDIYAYEPMSRNNIFVDASNGEILFSENLIHTSNVPGTAHTKYSGVKIFTTDSVGPSNYRLRETSRGLGVETYNFKNGTSTTAAVDFTDADNDWNNINSAKDEVASDAHWGAEQTYDYYKTTFNRNSINNNGFKLLSYVHYGLNYNNAFWNGQYMSYGDGNGTLFTPLTALDVCGHEISHGLTSNTANLVYQNESGALNESFSDIFGTTIEFFGRSGAGNWKIGEDMTPGGAGIRSMLNPKLFSNPNTYLGAYWATTGDNGGVHTNSGVQNYWYYLMCQGGSGSNDNLKTYNITGMGMSKAAAITYRNLTVYLTNNSKYADARFYSILAAKDLYGACAAEVKTTTNAWAAVGVGADYDTTLKANFNSADTVLCGTLGTAKFNNSSSFAADYFWDFGDGGTSTLANPTHTYNAVGNYTVKLRIGSCSTPIKYDSTTRTAYIKVSTTHPTCLTQKMPSGTLTGSVITLCEGKLRDNGDTANYSANTNSTRTIAPTNAGYLKLVFKSFNFESGYDFLSIYDGPSIASPLIGKFTGTALPNGGTITSSGGALTLVQKTDQASQYPGFELDWQCYMKSSNDIAVIGIIPIKNVRLNTPEFTNTSSVAAIIKNVGTVAQSNIPVFYSVNGGASLSAISSGLILPNDFDTVVFSTPVTNNIGNYKIKIYSALATDTLPLNDTNYFSYKIVENDPVTLPYFEGFEAMGIDSSYAAVFAINGLRKFDYENDDSTFLGRFRSAAYPLIYRTGVRAFTMDRNNSQTASNPKVTNLLTLTINLSNYTPTSRLFLDFGYMNHGDEQDSNDAVWIRGNMSNSWIKIYDLWHSTDTFGVYYFVSGLRIDSLLSLNGQFISSSTQIRWGQDDNGQQVNLKSNDGFTFDDIRLYKVNVGIQDKSVASLISIYPNPASKEFSITGIKSDVRITMTDAAGKIISTTETSSDTLISTRDLAKGVYFLTISNDEINLTKKLFVE